MRIMLCMAACLMAAAWAGEPTEATEQVVEVVAAEGDVAAGAASASAGALVRAHSVLPRDSVVTTGPHAHAVVRVGTDGYIVLGNNSKVEINKSDDNAGFFRHVTGMIYYALNLITGKRKPMEVRTVTATLGIRGTRFLVAETDGRNEVGMRRGLLSVTSVRGEFELHRKAEAEDFEAFKREAQEAKEAQKREFEQYKAQRQREFIEYKHEFGLPANRMATFEGNKVVESPLDPEFEKDMESFESYAGEWLQQVHD